MKSERIWVENKAEDEGELLTWGKGRPLCGFVVLCGSRERHNQTSILSSERQQLCSVVEIDQDVLIKRWSSVSALCQGSVWFTALISCIWTRIIRRHLIYRVLFWLVSISNEKKKKNLPDWNISDVPKQLFPDWLWVTKTEEGCTWQSG